MMSVQQQKSCEGVGVHTHTHDARFRLHGCRAIEPPRLRYLVVRDRSWKHKQRERPCWCTRGRQTISCHPMAREDARLQTLIVLPRGVMLMLGGGSGCVRREREDDRRIHASVKCGPNV